MKFTLYPNRDPRAMRRRPQPSGFNGAGFRLVFLLVMLVLVIFAMNRAGRPESWHWLFGTGDRAATEPKTGAPDTPPSPPSPPSRMPSGQAEFVSPAIPENDDQPTGVDAMNEVPPIDPGAIASFGNSTDEIVAATRIEFWSETIKLLKPAEQIQLLTLVRHGAAQKELEQGQTAALNHLLTRIAKRRQAFHVKLLDQMARPGGTPPSTADSVADPSLALVEIQRLWDDEILPALRAVIDQRVDPSLQTLAVRDFPALLDAAADTLIRDNTQVSRNAEAYAWFSAWHKVFDAPLQTAAEQAVTITQLFGQPSAFRGKSVTIRGSALRVDRIRAGRNNLGIEDYFVVWIKPDHVSSYPFCLYTLMLPEPLVLDPGMWSQDVGNIPITAAARFFKIRLYDAGEPAQAPLLMSASLEVVDQPALSSGARRGLPSASTTLLMVVLIGGLAATISWRVYRTTQSIKKQNVKPQPGTLAKDLVALGQDARVETVAEKLNRMTATQHTDDQE